MNKMKSKKYYTVGTVPKSSRKIVTHKYMTADFPGLVLKLEIVSPLKHSSCNDCVEALSPVLIVFVILFFSLTQSLLSL